MALIPIAAALAALLACADQAPAIQPYSPDYADPALEDWRWRSYPELKGLGLRCMAEAADGALFFGMDDGVRRYDGVEWTIFGLEEGLPDAPVNALLAVGDVVYAGTDWGISRLAEGRWHRVFPSRDDIPFPVDRILQARDGALWAATGWGALRLGPDGPRLYTTAEMGEPLGALTPGLEVAAVPEGAAPFRAWGEGAGIEVVKGRYMGIVRGQVPLVVWALAPGGPGERAGLAPGDHILLIDGVLPNQPFFALRSASGTSIDLTVWRPGGTGTFKVTVETEILAGGVRGFSLSDLFEDREGRMWLAVSWGGEIVRYDPVGGAWRLYDGSAGLRLADSPRLLQTRDGAMWSVSNSDGAGINRYDGGRWEHIDLKALGGSNIGTSLIETADGTLWVGEHLGHLFAYRDGRWASYPASQVPTPQTRVVDMLETADQGLWLAGLGQEAVRFDYGPANWTTYNGLTFRAATPQGDLWFLISNRQVVRYDGARWILYGAEDGMMDKPMGIFATSAGEVWVAGSHQDHSATARLVGERWVLEVHAGLAHALNPRVFLEAQDASLWFAGFGVGDDHHGGLIQYRDGAWVHHIGTQAVVSPYALAQTADGRVWAGGPLRVFDGTEWRSEAKVPKTWIHSLSAPRTGGVWVGTRIYGAYHFDGDTWRRYTVRHGLVDNWISSLDEMPDGSIWAGTPRGYSRFDGHSWSPLALPIGVLEGDWPVIQLAPDGALWFAGRERSIRHRPESVPPDTELTLALAEVSEQGQTTLAWRGVDPWDATPAEELHYAWRLNGGEWAPYDRATSHTFTSLSGGDYTFEVVARDQSFNVDPTPATARFTVLPPVWRRPWFLGLMGGLLVLVAMQTGRVVRRDRRLRESNHRLQEQAQELADANRQLGGLNAVLSEANVEIQRANEAKSAFLANMSHEIRTPLNAILGYAQILRDDALAARQRRAVETIENSGDHLLALINDVLDLSRIEAGRMELREQAFDLARLVGGLGAMFGLRCEQKGLGWRVEAEGVGGAVTGDEGKLRQVLINLLGNAVKFTRRGEVVFAVRPDAGRHYSFEVRDTGPGIAAGQQARIMEPFEQGAEGALHGGTGLGLAIARRHIELMGGELGLASVEGQGSRFFFALELPAAPAAALAADASAFVRAARLAAGHRVAALVVDDIEENREVLAQALERVGVAVRLAASGAAALELAAGAACDVVFMDIRMPGMDGIETRRRFLQLPGRAATRTVAISGSVLAHEQAAYTAAGFDAFIAKPFRREQVCACMAELLGVEYEYEAGHAPDAAEVDPAAISLPGSLRAALRDAAEVQNVTELAELLVETEARGEAERALAARIRVLMRRYEMEEILDLLDKVREG